MHPKNTTGHNRTQYPPPLEGRLAIVTVYGPDLGIELPPILTKGLEDEAIAMLRQALPSVRLSCVYLGLVDGGADMEQQADRHRDIIISCRGADLPGLVYAERLGLLLMLDELAPQKPTSPVRGAGGEAC
ncbi:hypothetical protein ABE521_20940 [Pseudomonas sp. TWI672]|uniref:hypothetical protein n=1 Tax=unclassified Pseudomonas TaxID=196821 RepID=UPI002ACC434D|nr:hypothetical protein [Pseudomonas putida]HEN8718657.1 hypothetical protein [Pseudomonas putida]